MYTRLLRMAAVAAVLALVFALAAPATARALDLRQGQSITIGSAETINDDVYAFGSTIQIAGTVNGDVVAAGQTVVITGKVTGDVIAAAQTVQVSGPVGGTVRAAGAVVEIGGPVGGDALASGGNVTVGANAVVARDIALAGNTATVAGKVGRNALIGAQTTNVQSAVGGDLLVSGATINLAKASTVSGKFEYWSNGKPTVDGTIAGATVPHAAQVQATQQRSAGASAVAAAVGWVRAFIGWAIAGVGLLLIAPRLFGDAAGRVVTHPWPSLGVGLLAFFIVPAVSLSLFVLGVIVGGWWISLAVLSAWLVLLIAGFVVGVLTVGELLSARMASKPIMFAAMLLGLLLVTLVGAIPIVGWIATFGAMLIGTGALALIAIDAIRAQRPPKPAVAYTPDQGAPSRTTMAPTA